MEAEDETLALFEFNWFCRFILSRSMKLPPLLTNVEIPVITVDFISAEPPPTTSLSRHGFCLGNELTSSPGTPIQSPILQTIYSGKNTAKNSEPIRTPAATVGESRERSMRRDRYRRCSKRIKIGGSRSLSDLEFEELKGFIDLGFTFSDAETSDPWLISIVPGLQRLRKSVGRELPLDDFSLVSETTEEFAVARPYLSEAWEVEEEEEEERGRILRNWRKPAEVEEIDLKDQLRLWAHAVASAVL